MDHLGVFCVLLFAEFLECDFEVFLRFAGSCQFLLEVVALLFEDFGELRVALLEGFVVGFLQVGDLLFEFLFGDGEFFLDLWSGEC